MSDETTFIAARNRREADDIARDLELRPREWYFLADARALRGRPSLRIAFGHRWFEHRAAAEIEAEVAVIERRRPGSVERVEVPA